MLFFNFTSSKKVRQGQGADIADAMEKASRMNKMLGKLRQDVEKLNQRYGTS
jgi:hypothetical protein